MLSAYAGAVPVSLRDMKTRLNCPCGEYIVGTDEDDLVAKVQAHLAAEHPGREYDRESILFMAS